MTTPVLLVLGAGPKIGLSVGQAFAAKGYKVAEFRRRHRPGWVLALEDQPCKHRSSGDPESIYQVLMASDGVALDPEDPLSSVSISETTRIFATNTISPLIAAQEAVKGFKQLPTSASRTFIATGNLLNTAARPPVLTFGMSKSALAHLIWGSSIAYEKRGFKFYYADERQEDGGATIPVSGPAAGRAYTELAEKEGQGKWLWTFVDGKGYVES
ncbi:hypothetical protein K504DRAFT_445511 [Pleomassaria siparia CBS 279.74]|uniref:NAD(P)-binding protein n=1 Tax=Pleomassaria siparia CBS 279.74 TaxID=1314801 RepID=A0A6G1KNQ2_9PLEO|nr:hypothetical protein K504DRAFT_445511 [Pleomassaria siparia CBS 279.74]